MGLERKSALSLIFALGIAVLSAWRLTLGIDFTDESYYASTTYRFLLGDRPFIDDLSISQIAPAIGAFLLKHYYMLSGEGVGEGLILKLRIINFLFILLSSSAIFRWTPGAFFQRIIVSTIPVSFTAINIQGLGYNNLSASLLTISVAAAAAGISRWRPSLIIIAGFAFSVACATYPTLCFAAPFYIFILSLTSERQYLWQTIGCTILGLFLAVLIVLTILGFPSLNDLRNSVDFTRSTYIDGRSFFELIKTGVRGLHTPIVRFGLIGLLIVMAYSRVTRRSPRRLVARFLDIYLVGILIQVSVFQEFADRRLIFGSFVILCLRFLTSWLKSSPPRQSFPLSIQFGSLFGLAIGLSSGNGILNFSIGAVGATALLLNDLMNGALHSRERFRYGLYVAVSICIALLLTWFKYTQFYRERPLRELDSKVSAGAFSGILMSQAKRNMILDLTASIKKHESRFKRIFIYDRLPAGYLMSSLPPATPNTWICVPFYYCDFHGRAKFAEFLIDETKNTLVVEVMPPASNPDDQIDPSFYTNDPLRRYIRENFNSELDANERYRLLGPTDLR